MVANIRSGSSPGGALRYNKEKVDKDEAEVLLWQKMLEPFDKHGRLDIDACMDSFWPYLEANRRTTNTVFHASLNPSPEDRLTDEQLREIANEYMQKMGYGDQPYIVFKHKDIDRQHLHIVSLRVDEKGCKLPHDFEARRSAEITRDLEHKYNLHPAVKGQEQRDTPDLRKVNYKTGNVKHQISSVVRSCLRNYKCSSYGEFRTLLELFNVSVEERTGTIDERNYAGIVYGAMTDDGYGIGTPFKSSRIGRDVGYKFSEAGKQGDLMGGGITAGYQLRLNKALALDFNLGLGYLNADFEKYEVIDGVRVRCGNETKNWCGPINAGVTLVWKLF